MTDTIKSLIPKTDWREINAGTAFPVMMFVVQAFNVCNGVTDGKPYTSDPWCVWLETDGSFARWPHIFKPTHWYPLPEEEPV